MKIAIDTNFLVSATQWDYSVSNKLLQNLIRNNAEIFASKEILDEFAEVLKRDFQYSKEEVSDIFNKVLQFLTIITPIKKVDIVKEDADNNKIIECALEGNVEYILSYDNHLLKLKEFQGIKIITPEKFLKINF
jgi:uncharacterized protein